MNITNHFCQQRIIKTLRFRLEPVGYTAESLRSAGVIDDGEKVYETLDLFRIYCDDWIRQCITMCMDGFFFDHSMLRHYAELCLKKNRSKDDYKAKELAAAKLRAAVCELFKKSSWCDILDGGKGRQIIDCVKKVLETNLRLSLDERKEVIGQISCLSDHIMYLKKYRNSRGRIFTEKKKHTAIPYRIVNDNLPKHFNNTERFSKIYAIPELAKKLNEIFDICRDKFNVSNISGIFSVDFADHICSQRGIDAYNALIRGWTFSEGCQKIQGINEIVKMYNDEAAEGASKLPLLTELYRQILFEGNSASYVDNKPFKKDVELIDAVKGWYKDFFGDYNSPEAQCAGRGLVNLLQNLAQYNLDKVYISGSCINSLSKAMTGEWDSLINGLTFICMKRVARKHRESDYHFCKRIKKLVQNTRFFSISDINQALRDLNLKITVEEYYKSLGSMVGKGELGSNLFMRSILLFGEAERCLVLDEADEKHFVHMKGELAPVISFLEEAKKIRPFIKPLHDGLEAPDGDADFYDEFMRYWDMVEAIKRVNCRVRNYISKNESKQEKIPLQFFNGQLLQGWHQGSWRVSCSFLLRRKGAYYLALNLPPKGEKLPFEAEYETVGEDDYELLVFDYLLNPVLGVPRIFFAKDNKEKLGWTEELLDIKDNLSKSKDRNDLTTLLSYYIQCFHKYYQNVAFNFKAPEKYNSLKELYRDAEAAINRMTFRPVPAKVVENAVNEGKTFLFKLSCKDFSEHSKGKPNLHTLYFLAALNEHNYINPNIMLKGGGEVFFKYKKIKKGLPTHPKGEPIANKNKNNPKKFSVFAYDLIKDKRFTDDSFQVHLPIMFNYHAPDRADFNSIVRNELVNSKDMHIIGIDRGVRNLVYISVIDLHGNIKEQFSLNVIENEHNGTKISVDYQELLANIEKNRQQARRECREIKKISDTKEGYLSQVVHKIVELMFKYNAIVAIEDLDKDFKHKNRSMEKAVYDKFALNLNNKLSFLVFKDVEPYEAGSVFKAYQLAGELKSLKDFRGIQNGLFFRIPAELTSEIDPVTGFANLFDYDVDLKYSTLSRAVGFFELFDSIVYNNDENRFEFTFDYNKFPEKKLPFRSKWTVCSVGERIHSWRDCSKNYHFNTENVNLTGEFVALMQKFGIDYTKGDIKDDILRQKGEFFQSQVGRRGFVELFKFLMQVRNIDKNKGLDYILSPVADSNGNFFDSRKTSILPIDGDANGAYNVARKALMAILQMREFNAVNDKNEKCNVKMDLNTWLDFAINMPYRKDCF